MAQVTYEVVEHDGGWAYKVGDVFSETFATHEEARRAADAAAHRQQLEGEPEVIEYEDAGGQWHTELTQGGDRPETGVADEAPEPAQERAEEMPPDLARRRTRLRGV